MPFPPSGYVPTGVKASVTAASHASEPSDAFAHSYTITAEYMQPNGAATADHFAGAVEAGAEAIRAYLANLYEDTVSLYSSVSYTQGTSTSVQQP